MKKLNGKIILVDDHRYEKALLKTALLKKYWDVEIEYFKHAKHALIYLKDTKDEIFLVISDMNMPEISGLEFKKIIDNDVIISTKSIPFIFTTNAATREQITEAYMYRVQGYFKKADTIDAQAEMLDIIIKYWINSKHPNKDGI